LCFLMCIFVKIDVDGVTVFGFYWLLIPVQVIAWKDSPPK